jgi:hypothetical protein
LADLASISQDLTFTIACLKRLRPLLKDDDKNHVLQQSLWTAALISYIRCFSSGKRFGLHEDIFVNKNLNGDPVGCHRYYKSLRDRHIAHSVNPFEQIAVDLQLSKPDSGKQEVLCVTTLSLRHICSTVEGVETLLRLASFAQKEVAKQAKEYEAKTLEVGKSLPIDTLYSKARSRITAPGPEDAGKARES